MFYELSINFNNNLNFAGNASSESHMIVLGEVPPSRPEQEQESAQDVAAQWLQSEDQKMATSVTGTGNNNLATTSNNRQDMPPVPHPRQRFVKERSDIRILPFNRNRKSFRRRIMVTGNHIIPHLHTIGVKINIYATI